MKLITSLIGISALGVVTSALAQEETASPAPEDRPSTTVEETPTPAPKATTATTPPEQRAAQKKEKPARLPQSPSSAAAAPSKNRGAPGILETPLTPAD